LYIQPKQTTLYVVFEMVKKSSAFFGTKRQGARPPPETIGVCRNYKK
jgi:hypothetical protein